MNRLLLLLIGVLSLSGVALLSCSKETSVEFNLSGSSWKYTPENHKRIRYRVLYFTSGNNLRIREELIEYNDDEESEYIAIYSVEGSGVEGSEITISVIPSDDEVGGQIIEPEDFQHQKGYIYKDRITLTVGSEEHFYYKVADQK